MSNYSSHSSVVGKELIVQVSEPWDFTSAEGTNELKAEILSVTRAGRVLTAVTSEEVSLPRAKISGRRLLVEPRYVGHRLSSLAGGRKVVVDIGIVEEGKSDAESKLALSGLAFLKGSENGRIVG